MARSIKKGPYVDANLEKKVLDINEGKLKKGVIQNMEPSFNDHTGFRRAHIGGS